MILKILVTGGAGFSGSSLTHYQIYRLLRYKRRLPDLCLQARFSP